MTSSPNLGGLKFQIVFLASATCWWLLVGNSAPLCFLLLESRLKEQPLHGECCSCGRGGKSNKLVYRLLRVFALQWLSLPLTFHWPKQVCGPSDNMAKQHIPSTRRLRNSFRKSSYRERSELLRIALQSITTYTDHKYGNPKQAGKQTACPQATAPSYVLILLCIFFSV